MANKNVNAEGILSNILYINKFHYDEIEDVEVSLETPWLEEVFNVLEGDNDDEDLPEAIKARESKTVISFKRAQNSEYKEHLIVRAHIDLTYQCPCIRCLVPTTQNVQVEVATVFAHPYLSTQPEYEEVDEVFCDGETMDLYFHEKGKVDISEYLHEQVMMHANPLPLHDENCKGLCFTCGANKNEVDCGH